MGSRTLHAEQPIRCSVRVWFAALLSWPPTSARRNSLVLTVPTFATSWLVSEAAPELLAMSGYSHSQGSAQGAERGRRTRGQGLAGLGLTAAAAAGAVGLDKGGGALKRGTRRSLSSTHSGRGTLREAPAAVRLGAVLPMLNGNRRRQRTRNVVFNTPLPGEALGPKLKLDIYAPLDSPLRGEKRPAVLQIHGGVWILGSKDEQGIPLLNRFGFVWLGRIQRRLPPESQGQVPGPCRRLQEGARVDP